VPLPDTIPPAERRDPDQDWFWTPAWQQGEREVDAAIARGEVQRFDSLEALLTWLDEPEDRP
jgi:hypothetical protein